MFYVTGRSCLCMCWAIYRLVDSSLHIKVDDHYINDFQFLYVSYYYEHFINFWHFCALCSTRNDRICFDIEFSGQWLNSEFVGSQPVLSWSIGWFTFSSCSHDLKENHILLFIISNLILRPSFKYWSVPSFILTETLTF